MRVVAADHVETSCAFVQVGEGIAHGSGREEHVIVVAVLHAEVLVLHLVLEGPLVFAYLFCYPLEAFLLSIEVAPIDEVDAVGGLVPTDCIAIQLVGHAFGLACVVARKLCAVANDEIRLSFLDVVGIEHPLVAFDEVLCTCARAAHEQQSAYKKL